jgi:hypothetical protein
LVPAHVADRLAELYRGADADIVGGGESSSLSSPSSRIELYRSFRKVRLLSFYPFNLPKMPPP